MFSVSGQPFYLGFHGSLGCWSSKRCAGKVSLGRIYCFLCYLFRQVAAWYRHIFDLFSRISIGTVLIQCVLSLSSHNHSKDQIMPTSSGGICSPRKYHRGSSYPDKNKRCAQALAIVLIHTYSSTVTADWNHRMFLVISIPTSEKQVKNKRSKRLRLHRFTDFFQQLFTLSTEFTCKQSPSLKQYLFLCHISYILLLLSLCYQLLWP